MIYIIFFARDFIEVLNQCCSRKCKGSVKLREEVCNLEFLQILLENYFNTFQQSFCPTRADFFYLGTQ